MADFEITTPDGRKFIVSGENAQGAYEALAQMLGQEAPRGIGYGPDGMTSADRIAAAKAGTLVMSPERGAQQAEIDLIGEQQIRDPGLMGALLAGATQGATLGFGDEFLGGLAANAGLVGDALTGDWSGMIDRAGSRYEGMRDDVRGMYSDAQFSRPWTTTGAEVAGGMVPALTGIGAAGSGASLGRQAAYGAATGLATGGAYGFGSAEGGFGERAENAAIMGGIGLLAGGAAPYAIEGVKRGANALWKPIASALNVPSDVRAGRVIETLMKRSGMSADDVDNAIAAARAEGQPDFMVVDALGPSGQRGLSGIARQPGPGREYTYDFLTRRQEGQGNRVAAVLADALDAQDTAAAREAAMKATRGATADAAYEAARTGAGPVDVRGALSVIDERIGPMKGSGVADDGISAKLSRYRGRLAADDPAASVIKGETGMAGAGHNSAKTAVELSDFDRVLILKQDIGDDIGAAVRAGRNNEARELMKVQKALDEALEAASPGYRAANDEFAKASKAIAQIDEGASATSGRVRSADTTKAFAAMTPEEQAAFRAGYGDRLIGRVESSAPGVNKVRPLMSDKSAEELAAMAKDPKLLARQLMREDTMFGTNVAALGGSKTADNLADIADMSGMSASTIANILTGRWGAAATQLADRALSGASGMNPSTRDLVVRALLSGDPRSAIAPVARRAAAQRPYQDVIEALIMSGAIRMPVQ